MADDLGLISPRLKYLSLKKRFLGKYLDKRAWGEFGSKEQYIAVSGFLDYFAETKKLAEEFPELYSDVIVDNKNLVIEQIIPLPAQLYEQLLMAAVEEESQLHWLQPCSVIVSRFERFLKRKKSACLAALEHNVWHRVHDYDSYSYDHDDQHVHQSVDQGGLVTRAQLRKLRNKIYARLASNQTVEKLLEKYQVSIEAFINESELTVDQADSFQDRLRRTANAVKYSKLNPWKEDKSDSVPKVKTYLPLSESEADELDYRAEVDEATSQYNHELGGQNLELSEPECPNLPDVPEGSPGDGVDHGHLHQNVVGRSGSELDEEILTRLNRLKFFSYTWGQMEVSNPEKGELEVSNSEEGELGVSNPEEGELGVSNPVRDDLGVSNPERVELGVSTAEKHEQVATVDTVAFTSTESDRLQFNRWYYETINKDPSEDRVDMSTSTKFISDQPNVTQSLSMFSIKETKNCKQVDISDTLDMICKTNSDTSYIALVNALYSDPSNDNKDTLAGATKDTLDDNFIRLQEDKLLATLYSYQVHLVGLVIVCCHTTSQLEKTVNFLHSFTAPPDPPPPTRPSIASSTATSAPVQGDNNWFWDSWLSGIRKGKRVSDLVEVANEAMEENLPKE